MSTPYNPVMQGLVPPSTIVPTDDDLFVPYLTGVYEDLAGAVNNKDNIYYAIAISHIATNIPGLNVLGSYIICVSGEGDGLPCITASLCKSSATSAGSIAVLGSQAGITAPWSAATLTITSTATNFQIKHSVSGVTGAFNVRIIGTQGSI